jgi:hypothetical protein
MLRNHAGQNSLASGQPVICPGSSFYSASNRAIRTGQSMALHSAAA